MKVDQIIPGTPVIYYQRKTNAGFLEDPVQTKILTEPWHTSERHFCKVEGFDNYVDIEMLELAVEPSREVKELKSMINRLKGHIQQVKADTIFTDYDRKILVPRYESNLLLLERKLELQQKKEKQRANEINVVGSTEIN